MANSTLGSAKKARKDEFYTQYIDIQKEVEAYLEFDEDTFRGKVVYSNCDDPFESNFFKFFAANFNRLGLKKLITTSYDGSRVALQTNNDGVVLWNPYVDGPGAFESIGGLRWCRDLPFIRFGTNFCDVLGEDAVNDLLGPVPVLPTDMTDDGSILIGRAGSFFNGFAGAFWSEPTGWMTWERFFAQQGVAEAANVPFNNPIAMSASGSEVVGGIAGASFSWHVNIDQVYVCKDGESVQTGFPNGMFEELAAGAEFGRCEHID